ncbi:MAG TPA: hypothetical protein PKA27_09685, partial [Fimbriimonadaceae bacterium]|nr:hypothetical protein [Fimbriimonadaceae bacterium]
MRSIASALFVGLIAVLTLIFTMPQHELVAGKPIQAVNWRSAKLGDVPDGALMKAVAVRDSLASSADDAGVYPGGWTWLGPGNIGGRVREILIHPSNTNIMWTGACSGGIWKTTDGGASWQPMDDFMSALTIGCMALDPANPNTIYVGTGEGFFETIEGTSNTAAVRGAGIWKSEDGGLTWAQLTGTSGSDWYFVNRLAIHPTNSNVMLAATATGIYRTSDAGTSWTRTSDHFAYDVRFHPTDGSKTVAGLHHDGALVSSDGGATWTVAAGLGQPHRVELRYARSNPSIVFAAVSDADRIKIYRSVDGGSSYSLRTSGAGISTYEAYNSVLWVDPTNVNNLIVGGVYLYRSTDSGVTLTQGFTNVHADMHAIVDQPGFNGSTNRRVFFGTDGGIYRANDWTSNTVSALNTNLGITQFYGAAMNPNTNIIVGGTQDNGTKRYSGNPLGWTNTFGGDGGYCAYDPTNSNYFYGEIYWAQMFRSTNGGTSASYVYQGIGDAGSAANCNFIPFFMLDPNNANTLLMGARSLWRSTNIKATTPSWTAIKPTIENGDGGGGGAHFAENPPWNISTMAVAKQDSNVIWVGYNNGQVWKTSNGLAAQPTWVRVDDQNGPMPERWVSTIAIDPSNVNRVFVAYMGYHEGNVWMTTNGGTAFSDASGTGSRLPAVPVSAFSVHPLRPNWLYAGTEIGLFVSEDGGVSWSTQNQGPSLVPIEQLIFLDNAKLFVVTHGRGCYLATVSTTTDYRVASSVAPRYGARLVGKLSDLHLSDNEPLTLVPSHSLDQFAPAAIVAESTAPADVASIQITLESRTSEAPIVQSVYLHNFVSGAWELVDTTMTATSDGSRTITPSGTSSRFIEPSSRR